MRATLLRLCYHRNFPKKYLEKEQTTKDMPVKPRTKYRYTEHRPWSMSEKGANHPSKMWKHPDQQMIHAPLKDWTVYRGDLVQVLIGKDKGKRAEVVQVVRERNWCFVRGLNLDYKKQPGYGGVAGRIHATELPLDVAREIALIDPTDNMATAAEWRYTEEGEKVRVSKRTGRIIPLPGAAEETYEYKTRQTYREQPKDTDAKMLAEVTFQPTSNTFEEDIMQTMGIVETRKPPRTFWY